MEKIKIRRAEEKDFPYIQEKLKKYILDKTNVSWQQFFVAKNKDKTVGFARIVEHDDCREIASVGVDYYHRKKKIGSSIVLFLTEEAKKLKPEKPIYIITHRPGFFERLGFGEVKTKGPEPLEYKKYNKCRLEPSKNKIMKSIS